MNFLRDRKYTLVYSSQKCMAASSPATNQGTIFQEEPVINSLLSVSKPKFQVSTLAYLSEDSLLPPRPYNGRGLYSGHGPTENTGALGGLVIAMEPGFIPTEVGKVSRPTSTNHSALNIESTALSLSYHQSLSSETSPNTCIHRWESENLSKSQICGNQITCTLK